MVSWAALTVSWILDVHLLTSVLFVGASLAIRCSRQPAQRMLIAWCSHIGLVLLLALSALPDWPRTSLGLVAAHPQGELTPRSTEPAEPAGGPQAASDAEE